MTMDRLPEIQKQLELLSKEAEDWKEQNREAYQAALGLIARMTVLDWAFRVHLGSDVVNRIYQESQPAILHYYRGLDENPEAVDLMQYIPE